MGQLMASYQHGCVVMMRGYGMCGAHAHTHTHTDTPPLNRVQYCTHCQIQYYTRSSVHQTTEVLWAVLCRRGVVGARVCVCIHAITMPLPIVSVCACLQCTCCCCCCCLHTGTVMADMTSARPAWHRDELGGRVGRSAGMPRRGRGGGPSLLAKSPTCQVTVGLRAGRG